MKKLLLCLFLLLIFTGITVIAQVKPITGIAFENTGNPLPVMQNNQQDFNMSELSKLLETSPPVQDWEENREPSFMDKIAPGFFTKIKTRNNLKADNAEDLGVYDNIFTEENTSGNTRFGQAVASAGDFNGDGYDDWMVAAPEYKFYTGRVYIYFGSYEPDTIPDLILDGENPSDYFGMSLAPAGDVNGDGYNDIIIGTPYYRNSTGKSYVYFGGSNPDNNPDIHLDGEYNGDQFGFSVSTAGDVNNDGFDDILIGAPYFSDSNNGKVYLYLGGLYADNTEDITFYGNNNNEQFGRSISTAGDFNHDNYDDIIIGGYGNRAYLFYGGNFMNNSFDLIFTGSGTYTYGKSLSSAGDINHDGFDDIIIGEPGYNYNTGVALLYFGNYTPDYQADIALYGKFQNEYFGTKVSTAGDVNNDGYNDIVVGSGDNTGIIDIFLGSNSINTVADVEILGERAGLYLGLNATLAGDINNDGYNDIIAGTQNYDISTGRAYIYYGGINMDENHDLSIKGENTTNNFGYSVSSAGDVNGDGFDDVIVGARNYRKNTGRAYIYYGGVNANNVVNVTLTGEGTSSYFGTTLASAGDINNDGYDDVIVGAPNYNSNTGAAYVYFGGPEMDNIADLRMIGETTNNYFGYAVAGVDDINSDGFDDFIIGAFGNNSNTGRAYVYFGGRYPDANPDLTINGEIAYSQFGVSVSAAGDVNNDGSNDILIGANNVNYYTGKAYLYYGSHNPDNVVDIVYNGESEYDQFGYSLSSAGDMNNDGFDDIIIGAFGNNGQTGKAYVYFGGQIKENVPDITFTGESATNRFGFSVDMAGDINKDGYSDIFIGAYQYNNHRGRAYVYFGGETPENSVDLVLDPITKYQEDFGISVSGAGDVNNDGMDDLIIGAYNYPLNGAAYLYQGVSIPEITVQPANTSICEGSDGNIWLTVAGSGNMSYQWQMNTGNGFDNISDNTNYEGTNTNRLSIIAANTSMNGYTFRCLIDNSVGSLVSQNATITVDQPGSVAHAGYSQDVCGNHTQLNGNVPSSGTGKWSTTGNAVFTNPNLYNTEVTNLDDGENTLTWEITNGACSSRDVVTITSYEAIEAIAGEDASICDSEEYTLSGNNPAPGNGVWTSTNPDISFENAADFNTAVYNLPKGSFTLIWTISNGVCESSDKVEITANTSVSIITQPKLSTLKCSKVQISFLAEGDILSYQWQKDGVNISDDNLVSGTKTNTLSISDLKSIHYGVYQCVVTGICNQQITNTVSIANKSVVEDFSEKGFISYPNPANEVINFEFDDYQDITAFEIYNLNSKKVVYKQKVNAIENIDISHFDEGTYLVSIQKGNEIKKGMFIIHK